ELAAQAVDEDLGALAGVFGRGGEGVELGIGQLGRDVRRRAGRNVDPLRDQTAHLRGRALNDVELARADAETLRDAVADLAPMLAERRHLLLARDDRGRDRVARNASAHEERA